MYCWLNQGLCPQEEARVPALDRGFLYGDTLFETMRLADGGIPWLSRHLARISQAADTLGYAWPQPPATLPAILAALIAANGEREGVLRLTLSRGIGPRGPNPAGAHSPTLLITQSALPPDLATRFDSGYTLAISPWRKPAPDMLPNLAKHGNYLNSILAQTAAQQAGADDALLRAHDGNFAECSSSNLFVVHGATLRTPDTGSGALPGVMRAIVLELAAAAGMKVEQGALDDACLYSADEVFLTNAVRGLMPVRSIEQQAFPVPGQWTRQLAQALHHATVGAILNQVK